MNHPVKVSLSLNDLIHNKQHFKDIPNALAVLEDYNCQAKSIYCNGYYWCLCTKLHPDDKIDESQLNHIYNIYIQKLKDDPPYHGAEYSIVYQEKRKFDTFLDIYMHEMYRPPDENDPLDKGGLMYQKTLSETLVGKIGSNNNI
jgi:hypothetical protein